MIGNESVLFRVAHAGNSYPLMLSIDEHQFEVVAAGECPLLANKASFGLQTLVSYSYESYFCCRWIADKSDIGRVVDYLSRREIRSIDKGEEYRY